MKIQGENPPTNKNPVAKEGEQLFAKVENETTKFYFKKNTFCLGFVSVFSWVVKNNNYFIMGYDNTNIYDILNIDIIYTFP